MKSLLWTLKIICVATGLVVVTLDTAPNIGQRALALGFGVGLISWLFDVRNVEWVNRMVDLVGLARFRRIFRWIALAIAALGLVLALNQGAAKRDDAMLLYMGAVVVSGFGLTCAAVFARLKRMERIARGRLSDE